MPTGHLYEKHVYHESGDGGDFLGWVVLRGASTSLQLQAPLQSELDQVQMLAIPKLLMERLLILFRRINERGAKFRRPILAVAIVAFVAGCVISFQELGVSLNDLQFGPLLLLALVLVPLSIGYSAVNMVLMGKGARVRIGFVHGVRVSVYAQVAELLPIPGGAIVRTAALMKAGGTVMQSTGVVLGFSLLWIACAACGAGIALADKGWIALATAGGGMLAVLAIHSWLALRFGHSIALAATTLRVAGVCLVALRLATAFSAIGVAMPFITAFSFAFATVMGSAASIVPAGLGISEALSALLAGPSDVAPAAAFLAVALNRLIGLAIHLLIAAFFWLGEWFRSPSAAEL